MRLGVSGYLAHEDLYPQTFAEAARSGFTLAFTSLHVPEDRPEDARRHAEGIARAASEHGLELVADVSPRTLARFGGEDAWAWLARAGFARIRIDFGFAPHEVAAAARHLPIALNASTLPAAGARALRPAAAEAKGIHNFYPKPWTGLSLDLVASTAAAYGAEGMATAAFLAGDSVRRGPLGRGLPSVEDHRWLDPLAQAVQLSAAGCEEAYLGDPAASPAAMRRLARYAHDRTVTLLLRLEPQVPQDLATAIAGEQATRPDPSAYELRLDHSPSRLAGTALAVSGGQPRPRGAITVDLDAAGRYRGEVCIALADLPGDPHVAVLGAVAPDSLPLLDFIGRGQRLFLDPSPHRGTP